VIVGDARFESRTNDAGNKGHDLIASVPFRAVEPFANSPVVSTAVRPAGVNQERETAYR
jgi:hypothetical protein